MPLVKEVALAWWKEQEKSIRRDQQPYYQSFLDLYILPFLGKEEISTLTANRVDTYFVQVMFEQNFRKKLNRTAVAYGKSILQSIFDYAEKNGLADNLPKADLKFRINQKSKEGIHGCPYSQDTLQQIELLIYSERETFAGLAMGLAWYAGLKRDELLSLKRDDIDFENNLIKLPDDRFSWLEEPLREMLLEFLEENPGPPNAYIFISHKKTRFAGPSIALLIRKAKEKLGIEDETINLTGLRNNYILNKLNAIPTKDLPTLANGLGISAISLINSFATFLNPAKDTGRVPRGLYSKDGAYLKSLRQKWQEGDYPEEAYNVIWNVIKEELRKGGMVSIDGFGLFFIKKSPERYRHSIFTMEFVKEPEERTPTFFPYPELLLELSFGTNK